MAKKGKPEGNKRQRERDKRRKKEEKAARRRANTEGQSGASAVDADGNPVDEAADEAVDEASPPSENVDADVRPEP